MRVECRAWYLSENITGRWERVGAIYLPNDLPLEAAERRFGVLERAGKM